MNNYGFYGRQQAAIHHDRFGDLAHDAARVLAGLLVSRGLTAGTVTDLGCGSGILARVMTDLGYDVLGVDISPDMLALAEVNAPRAKFRNESLVDAAIPPSVAVTAIGEALNYATDPRAGLDATTEVAQRVYDALAPGGVFLFDVATPGRNLGMEVRERIHDDDDWMLCMRATEIGNRLDRRITIYTREPDGRYTRIDEHHVTHLYDPDGLRGALVDIGFEVEMRPSYGGERTDSTPPSGWTVVVASKPVP
ncbi:MAG: class I SAM-dependent methyltransferase [Acidimicrobiia bacterium]